MLFDIMWQNVKNNVMWKHATTKENVLCKTVVKMKGRRKLRQYDKMRKRKVLCKAMPNNPPIFTPNSYLHGASLALPPLLAQPPTSLEALPVALHPIHKTLTSSSGLPYTHPPPPYFPSSFNSLCLTSLGTKLTNIAKVCVLQPTLGCNFCIHHLY